MRNILLLSFLTINIILIFPSVVHSSEWCFINASKDNYYFIDSESISVNGKEITFWILKQDIKTGKFLFQKKFTMNCEDETIALRDVTRFGVVDNILEIFLYKDNFDCVEISPKSRMRIVEQVLCSDGKPRKGIKEYLKKPFVTKKK